VDGASDFRIWLQIMMPLATGGLALAVVIKFILDWSESELVHMMIDSADKMTLAWGIGGIAITSPGATQATPQGVMAAVVTFFIIPTILIFVGLQKWFIRGALEGLKF
jgi:ABC-type glycerol-3-phosphate transport system permease component